MQLQTRQHTAAWLMAGAVMLGGWSAAAAQGRPSSGPELMANAAPAAPQSVVVQVAPTPPSLEIYGFAMLDIGHDFKQIDPAWFDTMRVTKLPSYKDQFGRDHNTFAGVRQTRIGVRTSTPTTL